MNIDNHLEKQSPKAEECAKRHERYPVVEHLKGKEMRGSKSARESKRFPRLCLFVGPHPGRRSAFAARYITDARFEEDGARKGAEGC